MGRPGVVEGPARGAKMHHCMTPVMGSGRETEWESVLVKGEYNNGSLLLMESECLEAQYRNSGDDSTHPEMMSRVVVGGWRLLGLTSGWWLLTGGSSKKSK